MEEVLGRSEVARKLRREALEAAGADGGVAIVGPPGSYLISLATVVHQWSPRRNKPCLLVRSDDLELAARSTLRSEVSRREADSASVGPHPADRQGEAEDLESAGAGGTRVVLDGSGLSTSALPRLQGDPGVFLISHSESTESEDRFVVGVREFGFRVLSVAGLGRRREDVPGLADHLWVREARGFEGREPAGPLSLLRSGRSALEEYSWPGNVAELASTMRVLRQRFQGRSLGREEVLSAIEQVASVRRTSPRPARRWAPTLRSRISDLEKREILRALSSTGWNRRRSAEMLGLSRRTLGRRMEKLGIG